MLELVPKHHPPITNHTPSATHRMTSGRLKQARLHKITYNSYVQIMI